MLYGFAGSADLFSIKSEKKEDMRPLVRFEPLPFPRYISAGSTDTSLWTHYKAGEREYCGNTFKDGMAKNERLPSNVITPTTKVRFRGPV